EGSGSGGLLVATEEPPGGAGKDEEREDHADQEDDREGLHAREATPVSGPRECIPPNPPRRIWRNRLCRQTPTSGAPDSRSRNDIQRPTALAGCRAPGSLRHRAA